MPTPQNGQIHSNNSSATTHEFDHFVELKVLSVYFVRITFHKQINVSYPWFLSMPPENIKKIRGFLMFSGGKVGDQ